MAATDPDQTLRATGAMMGISANLEAGGAMATVVARQLLGSALALITVAANWTASATESTQISKYFPVCLKPIPGVTYVVRVGIDAAEGQFVGQGGAVDYMISYNPGLPASMGRGVRQGRFTESLQLLAESDGPLQTDAYGKPIGYGVERLYGLSVEDRDTPTGSMQEKIFMQLWADRRGQNVRLLKKVGDALHRCPK